MDPVDENDILITTATDKMDEIEIVPTNGYGIQRQSSSSRKYHRTNHGDDLLLGGDVEVEERGMRGINRDMNETRESNAWANTSCLTIPTTTDEDIVHNTANIDNNIHSAHLGDYDDGASVASSYSTMTHTTYNTYDTSATSESVHSIIDRLQSETNRRRRRLRRRLKARGVKIDHREDLRSAAASPNSLGSKDGIIGNIVEIKE